MPDVTYNVKATKGSGAFVKVCARDHCVVIDEPTDKGGTDAGMNPMELLLASIASCMTLTLSIYSEAMGVKVKDIEVDVEGILNSAGFKGSARVRPGFNQISISISAKTDVEPEVFQQVVDLAVMRCPVEDSVINGVKFKEPSVIIKKIND